MAGSNALSLFPGRKDGVLERMRTKVKKTLSNKDPQFLKWFAEEFDLTEHRVESLISGNDHVDFHFFEKVKEALDISIHDVLGKPFFRDGEKDDWSKQLKLNPMVLGAPAGKSNAEKSIQKEDQVRKDRELKLYVRLRAISELLGNP